MWWKARCVICLLLSLLFFDELASVNRQIEGADERIFEGSSFAAKNFERGWIGVMLSGSLLYWHPETKSIGAESPSATFGWDWGYNLKGGLFLPVVGYNVFGNYTHFDGRAERSPSGLEKVRCRINYNTMDIDLENGDSFDHIWRTFWGVRRVWVDRIQIVDHLECCREGCHFRGIGPRIGVGLKWHLFCGINLFLEGAASLLYGNVRVSYAKNQSELCGSSRLFAVSLSPNIGFGWGIYESWYHFELSIGYESEYYWNQNRIIEVGKMGPLQVLRRMSGQNFHGMTLRALVEF